MINVIDAILFLQVRLGCLEVKNVKDHVIVYNRVINNINLQHAKYAGAYVDLGQSLKELARFGRFV